MLEGFAPIFQRDEAMARVAALSLTVFLLFGCSASSIARSWYVDLQSGGDFTDIQPAVDAASEGDTIRIGPGRFDTLRPCVAPAWTEDVVVAVTKNDLTFIGSGIGVTIIGTASSFAPYGENPKCFCAIEPLDCTIQDMTIENVERGIYWSFGSLTVSNCEFNGAVQSYRGLGVWCNSLLVRDCDFNLSNGASGIGLYANSTDISVLDSRFRGNSAGTGVVVVGATGVSIANCSITDIVAGMQFEQGSSAVVSNCYLENASVAGIAILDNSNVEIMESELQNSTRGLYLGTAATVVGVSTEITGSTYQAIWLTGNSVLNLKNCHILPASGLAVQCASYPGPQIVQDLTANYWGTTDPEAIAELIWDGNDDPSLMTTVDFLPLADGPVAEEPTSWGDLKAMFRGR